MKETLYYCVGKSELGLVIVVESDIGLCAICIGDNEKDLIKDIASRFKDVELIALHCDSLPVVLELIKNPWTKHTLVLDERGTAFQKSVWKALREIPIGTTTTYGDIALKLGRPKAVRAVGTACGANPLAIISPCHRVISKSGKLSGFYWGLKVKEILLAQEAEQT